MLLAAPNPFIRTRTNSTATCSFESFVGTEIALLFPFASSRSPSECSFYEKSVTGRQHPIDWQTMISPRVVSVDEYSTYSDMGLEFEDLANEPNPWLSSPSGYESLHLSDAEEAFEMHTPLEYQGIEGIYRFIEQCESR